VSYDVAIIGAGIIGLATGLALTEDRPGLRLAVIDKETGVGAHQTGHNSGVLHSGIYYRPGSLKARLCLEGAEQMVAFCDENDVPLARQGKVIVATKSSELAGLDELERRGKANGVEAHRVGPGELGELEPHAAGIAALHVPSAGVVDFSRVADAMAQVLVDRGVDILVDTNVVGIRTTATAVELQTNRQPVSTGYVVNCAGLHADRVATLAGVEPSVRIVPFRGEYYRLGRSDLVNTAIYPVPDLDLPFLGVHITRLVGGEVEAGPNAVLALAREGYRWGDISPRDLGSTLAYRGSWRLGRRHWRSGTAEMYRSISKKRFAVAVGRLVPEVTAADLSRSGSGVRAQAVVPNGSLVDDFVITRSDASLHVLNAPSPGATASLAIGRYIAGEIAT
jgi:L-2-hydroxyglutarate oxidase